jgi:hypothetical protein
MKKYLFLLLLIPTLTNGQAKNSFDLDGYYFTETVIKNGDWQFDWLSIMVKPIVGEKKRVSVRFINVKTSKWIDIEAKAYKVEFDSVKIVFADKRIGDLSFQGQYVYSNKSNKKKPLIATENIELIGTFTFKNKTLPIKFSCAEGD